jgi:hypothetical protein
VDDDKTNPSSSSSFFLSFTTVTVSFVFLPLWKFALAKGWIFLGLYDDIAGISIECFLKRWLIYLL